MPGGGVPLGGKWLDFGKAVSVSLLLRELRELRELRDAVRGAVVVTGRDA
jgi:hypothetical protein